MEDEGVLGSEDVEAWDVRNVVLGLGEKRPGSQLAVASRHCDLFYIEAGLVSCFFCLLLPHFQFFQRHSSSD